MPKIKKILFPVDFSESCKGAARYVEALAGQFEAEITLVHGVTMGERVLAEELLPQRKEQLDLFLADEWKYFTTHRVCRIGDPVETILQEAASRQPDLVMLPTHGVGYFRRHLLGSVTAKLIHDLRCPVWTSVHAAAAPALEDIHCRRILCAVDLGDRSSSVLAWASWLAGQYNAKLGIVYAPAAVGSSAEAWGMAEDFQKSIAERAAMQIGALQAEVGTTADVFITPGPAPHVIAGAARDYEADLLVIGRHIGDGIAGDFFQNAYGILTGSPCPVISI